MKTTSSGEKNKFLSLDKGITLRYYNSMSRPLTDLRRYKKVLQLRAEGKRFEEIGAAIGVSRQRAWQIYNRAIKRNLPIRVMANPGHGMAKAS